MNHNLKATLGAWALSLVILGGLVLVDRNTNLFHCHATYCPEYPAGEP